MRLHKVVLLAALVSAQALAAPPPAEPFFATLTLDGLSRLSFGGEESFPIADGGTIRFEFQAASADGSLGFLVRPSEALLDPIPLRFEDESLEVSLARQATGSVRKGADGRLILEVDAYVVVTLNHPEEPGSKRLPIRLTTEQVTARGFDGTRDIVVSGSRTSPGGRTVQLVGATTNAADDYPRPGAPVYVVLSGSFDRLPDVR
jgi:hypothetical protein